MMLATIESLIGSVWFGLGTLLAGYIAGHIVPVHRVAEWLGRK